MTAPKLNKHHIWCNGVNPFYRGIVSEEEIYNCPWCGGANGLKAIYQDDGKTEDQLQAEHFPNVIKIT